MNIQILVKYYDKTLAIFLFQNLNFTCCRVTLPPLTNVGSRGSHFSKNKEPNKLDLFCGGIWWQWHSLETWWTCCSFIIVQQSRQLSRNKPTPSFPACAPSVIWVLLINVTTRPTVWNSPLGVVILTPWYYLLISWNCSLHLGRALEVNLALWPPINPFPLYMILVVWGTFGRPTSSVFSLLFMQQLGSGGFRIGTLPLFFYLYK